MAANINITQEQVRELFNYDPLTGLLTWRKKGGLGVFRHSPGDKAGSDDSKGYFQVNTLGKVMRLHRVIWCWMTGEWPTLSIDHIDGDGQNNRWANLRLATHSQNLSNRGRNRHNTSGFKGVSFSKKNAKWIAVLTVTCSSPEEAHEAYKKMATAVFGEFARFA